MNNTQYKHDKQINPHKDQQQKTRQPQEAKKTGQKPSMFHKDEDHYQVHEHESIETRMTR
jgi:hypothetical protein